MRNRVDWSIVPFALLVWPPLSVEAQVVDSIVGTYDYVICSAPCRSFADPTVLARGHLVLASGGIPLQAFSDTADVMLNWSYYQIRFIYDSEPNGCFVNGDVGTRPKTFAAYERVGVTRWIRSAKDHKVRFGMLWSGVDTHYYVAIEGELAGVLRGKGYPSAYPDGRDLKAEHFFARRIGDADPQICISAGRARNEG